MVAFTPRSSLALLLPAFGLGLLLGSCKLPNPDHCLNIAINANGWCASVYPDEPFCSPCEAENNGCVADEPSTDDCPAYNEPAPETGTDTGSTETETGATETGATETGATETETG